MDVGNPIDRTRLRAVVRGAVQGVGFRPFIYRLANSFDLSGFVRNTSEGVIIEVEGGLSDCSEFLLRIEKDAPPLAIIQSLEPTWLDPDGYKSFEISASTGGSKSALVLPDIATCADCRNDVADPLNRRYRYPFTNCTNCGPRYTIINTLPYDRPNTSMSGFQMCPECEQEYLDPTNRRFHAQPNACPVCGPRIALADPSGRVVSYGDEAMKGLVGQLLGGRIAAVKGLGGYHLMVDARNRSAVERLRERKGREAKPLAVMVPSPGAAKELCHLSPLEERLLMAPEAPILLLERRSDSVGETAANSLLAPGNPYLGVMLPYTPLHHILLADLDAPVVATSGNLSDEPICINESEAFDRLADVADVFLTHNRPIVRHVDDSIVRLVLGRELVMRRARGYAPLPVSLKEHRDKKKTCILAVGAHLKNTVAAAIGDDAFVSQHIGDLETAPAYETFRRVGRSLLELYDAEPDVVACDLHPDYMSTKFAATLGPKTTYVQHHHAHVLACMAENELDGRVLGISWDGTGYGTDGTIWGGEFLDASATDFQRIGRLRPFMLPGGERAVKEPRRSAAGLLFEVFGESAFDNDTLSPVKAFAPDDRALLVQMLVRGINSPVTSSAGRLFDGVASLLGICQRSRYEGEAAMQLEFLAAAASEGSAYPFEIVPGNDAGPSPMTVDWVPMLRELIADLKHSLPLPIVARRFHLTLAEMVLAVARTGDKDRIVLTGGCFQNRLLTELAVSRLKTAGFKVYWHQRIPPNDGGICLGQLVHARAVG